MTTLPPLFDEHIKTHSEFFKLLTEDSYNDDAILNYFTTYQETLSKAQNLGQIGIAPPLSRKDYNSPYLLAEIPGFFASMNYFHVAAASLCSPVVLDKIRTSMGIDLNQNPMVMVQGNNKTFVVGITDLFKSYYGDTKNPRLESEWLPKVRNLFQYLIEQDYDFFNPKETQLLERESDLNFASDISEGLVSFVKERFVVKEKNLLLNHLTETVLTNTQLKRKSKI